MIDGLPLSRPRVALVLSALVTASACSRLNPAYGDTALDGEKTDASVDDDGSASADDDDGDASATATPTTTDATDDSPEESGDTSNVEDESTGIASTTSGSGCQISERPAFDVSATNAQGDPIPAECGVIASWQGAVMAGSGPDEIVMAICAGGSCDCGGEATPVTLTFTDLAPSPADLLAGVASDCFSLSVSRRAEGNGCDVEWIAVEGLLVSADYPSYMAASSAEPGWSLVVPAATLGDVIAVCEGDSCEVHEPGEYEMFLGEAGPIVPGATVSAVLNPYAGVEASYDVTAQYAQVDNACVPHLGWAAIVPP